jgi:hypothetical protein
MSEAPRPSTDLQLVLEGCCATVRDLEARLQTERAWLAELRALANSESTSVLALGFVLPAAG